MTALMAMSGMTARAQNSVEDAHQWATDETANENTGGKTPITAGKPKDTPDICGTVEQMPNFAGGEYVVTVTDRYGRSKKVHRTCGSGPNGLMDYLSHAIRYPDSAERKGVEGRVVVSFIVEKDGICDEFKVVKPVDPDLDREAIRVLSEMPRWIPGKFKGAPVRAKYTVPITFRLQ